MTLNPEIQKKVQAEIHSNIGPRSPTMDDVHSLPYVMATIMEIQRLGVIAPGSLIHILLKDQQFNGYHFEKGTSIFSFGNKYVETCTYQLKFRARSLHLDKSYLHQQLCHRY